MTTAQATLARKTGQSGPVAGDGPAAQRTVVTATSQALEGLGGEILLNAASAGMYTLGRPAQNAVSLTIRDLSGQAHRVTLPNGTVAVFSGNAGSYVELIATVDGTGWAADSLADVSMS